MQPGNRKWNRYIEMGARSSQHSLLSNASRHLIRKKGAGERLRLLSIRCLVFPKRGRGERCAFQHLKACFNDLMLTIRRLGRVKRVAVPEGNQESAWRANLYRRLTQKLDDDGADAVSLHLR